MVFRLAIILIFILTIAFPIKANTYSIKDLEILESEGNDEDFLKHAFDIRPSERTKLWKKMLQNMATKMLDRKIQSKSYLESDFKLVQDLSLNSALFNDSYFQFKRQNYVTGYLKHCFSQPSSKEHCFKHLESYWANSLKDADFAHDIIKILNNQSYDKWYLVESLTFDQMSGLYCKKDFIQSEILKKLKAQSFSENFDGHYLPLLTKLTSKKCRDSFYQILNPLFFSGIAQSIDREIALDLLIDSKLIKNEELSFYLVVYFLSNPVNGENLNKSWKAIELISTSFKDREFVLNKFKTLTKIPDQLFQTPERPREKALINHFAKHFPEALNFYAEECLKLFKYSDNSLAGSQNHCQNFFVASKNIKNLENKTWINESIHLKESAIKRP